MAKPFSVAPSDGPADFSTPPPRHSRPEDQPYKRRRRRKGLAAPTRSLAPSTTLLSLLSAIASSSVAEGSPPPPTFLCPSVQRSAPPTRRRVKRDAKPSTSTSVPSVPRAVVRNIADKFEQGEDGLWRRVDSYTLYGVCPGCSTSAVSAIDEQASRHPNGTTSTNNTSTSNTTASMDTDYDKIPDKLPPGWQPKEEMWGHESRTTLILAMSLVLAFLICFLIIGCLFWRKSMRRKHKGEQEQDVEQEGARRRKGRRRSRELDEDESREAILEKERANQKLWARATARWRANVRLKRRGKRSSQMSHARRSSISLDSPRDGLTSGRSSPSPSGSSPPSRSVSRRASSSSLRQESSAESSSAQQQQDTSTIPTISLSPPPPHSSPPAYQQKALQADLSSEGLFPNDDPASTSHLICSRRPSHSSFLSNSEGGSGAIPSIPSAHVATDDKAVLARLADLASAPEEDEGSSPQPQVSAPEWRDDEMEDFIAREACGGESDDFANQSTSTPSPFPPPPSKSSLLSPKFYDYPYAFEDMEIENLEPELGPSAPPFEETPSAPLVDEHGLGLVPSAPPMLDDDDFYVNDSPVPSAPPHEPSPSHSLTEDSDGNVSSAGQVVTGDGTASTGSGNGRPVLPDYHP